MAMTSVDVTRVAQVFTERKAGKVVYQRKGRRWVEHGSTDTRWHGVEVFIQDISLELGYRVTVKLTEAVRRYLEKTPEFVKELR